MGLDAHTRPDTAHCFDVGIFVLVVVVVVVCLQAIAPQSRRSAWKMTHFYRCPAVEQYHPVGSEQSYRPRRLLVRATARLPQWAYQWLTTQPNPLSATYLLCSPIVDTQRLCSMKNTEECTRLSLPLGLMSFLTPDSDSFDCTFLQ